MAAVAAWRRAGGVVGGERGASRSRRAAAPSANIWTYDNMAKAIGPLLSLDAAGVFGPLALAHSRRGTIIRRRPISTARQPSPAQSQVRSGTGFLFAAWSSLSPLEKDSWIPLAAQARISPFNAYVGSNARATAAGVGPSAAFPPTFPGPIPDPTTFSLLPTFQGGLASWIDSIGPNLWGTILAIFDTTPGLPLAIAYPRVVAAGVQELLMEHLITGHVYAATPVAFDRFGDLSPGAGGLLFTAG
jgi:hypothetical protein